MLLSRPQHQVRRQLFLHSRLQIVVADRVSHKHVVPLPITRMSIVEKVFPGIQIIGLKVVRRQDIIEQWKRGWKLRSARFQGCAIETAAFDIFGPGAGRRSTQEEPCRTQYNAVEKDQSTKASLDGEFASLAMQGVITN